MARVLADDENLAMATNDLAFVAHLLDRRTYLHICFLSVFLLLPIYHGQPLPMIFLPDEVAQTVAPLRFTRPTAGASTVISGRLLAGAPGVQPLAT